ncbi:hypothetical protein KC614_03035 [candidate division WWE3 bacterium]|uniref:Enolpyruvate transferase domain-containing protein n=1 Tax=candidate division WWE3 bacterium TaxID=2053526 RepID=A0A955RR53_UNCKA|nr:hypothetical protein [candidate division WWE3 bacterium]
MKQSLLLDEGGIAIRGEYTPSPDVLTAAYLLIASIVTKSPTHIHNIPQSGLMDELLDLLEFIGVEVTVDDGLTTNCEELKTKAVPFSLAPDVDLAWLTTITLLARTGIGGIELQSFPEMDQSRIRYYVSNLRSVGFEVNEEGKFVFVKAPEDWRELAKGSIDLKGWTPVEVCGLILLVVSRFKSPLNLRDATIDKSCLSVMNYLTSLNAQISITDEGIVVNSGITDQEASVSVPASLLETLFIIALTVLTKGEVIVKDLEKDNALAMLNLFNKMNISYKFNDTMLRVWNEDDSKLSAFNVRSESFPGFSSSWIEIFAVMASVINGESVLLNRTNLFQPNFIQSIKDAKIEIQRGVLSEEDLIEIVGGDKVSEFVNVQELELKVSVFGPSKAQIKSLDLSQYKNYLAPVLIALAQHEATEVTNIQRFTDRFPELLSTLTRFGYKMNIAQIP